MGYAPKSKFTLSGSSQPPSVVGVMIRSPLSPLPQESMSGLSMESWEAPSVPRAPPSWDVGCSEGRGRELPHEENMRPKHKKAAIDASRTNSRKVFVFMINSILHFFVHKQIKWLIICDLPPPICKYLLILLLLIMIVLIDGCYKCSDYFNRCKQ